jgi:hypothetical protein
MEMSNILIYAILGAVCVAIVTGGFLSMTGDAEPSTEHVGVGALAGASIGAATAYYLGDAVPGMASVLSSMSGGGSGGDSVMSGFPEMKVGLPSF